MGVGCCDRARLYHLSSTSASIFFSRFTFFPLRRYINGWDPWLARRLELGFLGRTATAGQRMNHVLRSIGAIYLPNWQSRLFVAGCPGWVYSY